MSYFHILEINPLLLASFANIFSHSVKCFFIKFMVSFVQKFLSLIVIFFFLVFISITVGDESKKILLWFMSEYSAYIFL